MRTITRILMGFAVQLACVVSTSALAQHVSYDFRGHEDLANIRTYAFKDVAPPGGNIPDTPAGSSMTRTFPTAGDYDYECTRHDGMKGRIRVR